MQPNGTEGDATAWYPGSGYRGVGSGVVGLEWSGGYYWSASPYSATLGYGLGFNSGNVLPQGSSGRGNGFPVRCVQE